MVTVAPWVLTLCLLLGSSIRMDSTWLLPCSTTPALEMGKLARGLRPSQDSDPGGPAPELPTSLYDNWGFSQHMPQRGLGTGGTVWQAERTWNSGRRNPALWVSCFPSLGLGSASSRSSKPLKVTWNLNLEPQGVTFPLAGPLPNPLERRPAPWGPAAPG